MGSPNRTIPMTHYPRVDRFESATIVLPVMNETASLEETVRIILRDVGDRTKEILIVVCGRTTPEAMATVDRLSQSLGGLVRVHSQTLPFLGGAMREAFDLARGSHVVMMASDLETDPNTLKPSSPAPSSSRPPSRPLPAGAPAAGSRVIRRSSYCVIGYFNASFLCCTASTYPI